MGGPGRRSRSRRGTPAPGAGVEGPGAGCVVAPTSGRGGSRCGITPGSGRRAPTHPVPVSPRPRCPQEVPPCAATFPAGQLWEAAGSSLSLAPSLGRLPSSAETIPKCCPRLGISGGLQGGRLSDSPPLAPPTRHCREKCAWGWVTAGMLHGLWWELPGSPTVCF